MRHDYKDYAPLEFKDKKIVIKCFEPRGLFQLSQPTTKEYKKWLEYKNVFSLMRDAYLSSYIDHSDYYLSYVAQAINESCTEIDKAKKLGRMYAEVSDLAYLLNRYIGAYHFELDERG